MRDDFTQSVKKKVAERVGYLCSNPQCRAQTIGPKGNSQSSQIVGVAAHITAASPGGPRFREGLTKEQRSGITNAIWLCETCAKLIDNDVDAYPEKLLYQWKDEAERNALENLGIPNAARFMVEAATCSLLVEHNDVPPFALAFEATEIPDCFFNIDHRDIPLSWELTWVDIVRIKITITNHPSSGPIVIDGIGVDRESSEFKPQSELVYIAQGASRALEFMVDVSAVDKCANPSYLNREHGAVVGIECDYFDNGGRITIDSGSAETIILSLIVTAGCYRIRPYLNIVIGGIRQKEYVIGDSGIGIVSSNLIPDENKYWSIHLDGRANGKGVDQDLLEPYRDALG